MAPSTEPRAGRRLSIVIPALNEAPQICATLADLQPLRSQGHQLILVDGGSQDGTPDLAKPLVDQLLTAPPGRARQMNAGAALAAGDVLWFLHGDTRIPPGAPRALLAALDRGAAWGRFDVRLSGSHPLLRIVERLMNLRSCVQGIATGDQGIFLGRALFQQLGGYPDQPLMEDIALSRALRRRGRPACVRERLVTSSRRWERRGILRTIWLMWHLRLAYALGADPAWLAERYR